MEELVVAVQPLLEGILPQLMEELVELVVEVMLAVAEVELLLLVQVDHLLEQEVLVAPLQMLISVQQPLVMEHQDLLVQPDILLVVAVAVVKPLLLLQEVQAELAEAARADIIPQQHKELLELLTQAVEAVAAEDQEVVLKEEMVVQA